MHLLYRKPDFSVYIGFMPYSPWTYCNIPTVKVWVYNPFYAMDCHTDISCDFDKTNGKICENKAITPYKARFCF